MKKMIGVLLLSLSPLTATASPWCTDHKEIVKQVKIQFVFRDAQPFRVFSEYGQCDFISAIFQYSSRQPYGEPYEFFPHIGNSTEMAVACSGEDQRLGEFPASQKIADALNALVVEGPAQVYTLTADVHYVYRQKDCDDRIFMEETMSFQSPAAPDPVRISNTMTVLKQ
jgi:hypothetical protein